MEGNWDTVIKPKEKLLSVDFKELWHYRDLCLLFVKRNIVVFNKVQKIYSKQVAILGKWENDDTRLR